MQGPAMPKKRTPRLTAAHPEFSACSPSGMRRAGRPMRAVSAPPHDLYARKSATTMAKYIDLAEAGSVAFLVDRQPASSLALKCMAVPSLASGWGMSRRSPAPCCMPNAIGSVSCALYTYLSD